MGTLWLKLSLDVALPERVGAEGRAWLSSVFRAGDPASLWSRAAERVGLPASRAATDLLRWESDVPYLNWSEVVRTVSGRFYEVVPHETQGYSYAAKHRIARLPALLKSQWMLENFLSSRLSAKWAAPEDCDEQICESLALGLAILALTLRLPSHSPEELASWLVSPARAPRAVKKTVTQLDAAQRLRTRLSPAWQSRLKSTPGTRDEIDSGVPFFWEGLERPLSESVADAAIPLATASETSDSGPWKALPVSPGVVRGRTLFLSSFARPEELPASPGILVFPQARPETTELFSKALGVIFIEGGVLSHACTVAREQGIPCVTGAGKSFRTWLQSDAAKGAEIEIDGASGWVRLRD